MQSGPLGYVLVIVILPFKSPVNCTFHTHSSWYNAVLCSLFKNDGSLGCSIPNKSVLLVLKRGGGTFQEYI